jgi:hypothetical protein
VYRVEEQYESSNMGMARHSQIPDFLISQYLSEVGNVTDYAMKTHGGVEV